MRFTMTLRLKAWPPGRWLLCSLSAIALLMLVPTTSAQAVADDSSSGGSGSPTVESTDESASTLQVIPQKDNPTPAPTTSKTPVPVEPNAGSRGRASGAAAQQALEPIPEANTSGPPKVETASFNGIRPGQSTMAEVVKKWGPAQEVSKSQGFQIHRYVVKPFDRVDVSFSADKVASIVVRLDKAFPAKAVAKQLRLTNIRPVLVSNELGDILGEAYPERGVLFAFQQNQQQGKPTMDVTEIILEPIGPDAFVLRAETNLQSNFKQNLRDLDEAIKVAPNNARAHWLRSRVLAATGQSDEALAASRKAIALGGNNARFRVTHAQILDQAGHRKEAITETARAITMSDERPHVKARAQCLMGDLLSDGPEPDWAAALKFHMTAIRTADPLTASRHPAIRLAAKEVMVDAHLGAANDIAWGRWGGKEKAVTEWTKRAAAFAEELIENDGGSSEHRFRVASRTLAAMVGVEGKMDPTDWVKEVVRVGNKLIDGTTAPNEKRQSRWELGMALFNAVQIYHSRKQYDLALEVGQQAVGYLEPGRQDNPLLPEQRYLLGRLHFRLGAIHALNKENHAAAVVWFDKAAPLLEEPLSTKPDAELGRHGETLVSMGVSYWETGQQEKAMQLTRRGLGLMKQAVSSGAMASSTLGVPYENLAAMHRHLGNDAEAKEMEKLAGNARTPKATRHGNTAIKKGETIRR